jgi:hypothetical protein
MCGDREGEPFRGGSGQERGFERNQGVSLCGGSGLFRSHERSECEGSALLRQKRTKSRVVGGRPPEPPCCRRVRTCARVRSLLTSSLPALRFLRRVNRLEDISAPMNVLSSMVSMSSIQLLL